MPRKTDKARKTITVCIHPEILNLVEKYLRDTFYRSRSNALETIILDFMLYNGYIDEADYQRMRRL